MYVIMGMRGLRKRIIFSVILCMGIYMMVLYSHDTRYEQKEKIQKETMEENGLTLHYTNDNLTLYLSSAAVEYEKLYDVKVNIEKVSSADYLQLIAQNSISKDKKTTDLYIVRQELLENAYAYGITSENVSDVYNEDKYAKTALDAVSYHGSYIGYPLGFHTSVLVYRSDLIGQPASLEQLMMYDISPFAGNGMEKSIDLNTGNVLSEYAFIGKYIDVGGTAGDEQETVKFDENMFSQSVGFFQTLITSAGVSPNAMEESMILGFAEGKNLSMILSSDYIALLNDYVRDRNVKYSLTDIPKLNDALESSTGSYTDVVVVNGMSVKQDIASEFAQFITYEYADNLFSMSHIYPALYSAGSDMENFDVVYEIYKKGNTLPKMLQTEDFSMKLKELFEKAAGGQDAAVLTGEFANSFRQRMT